MKRLVYCVLLLTLFTTACQEKGRDDEGGGTTSSPANTSIPYPQSTPVSNSPLITSPATDDKTISTEEIPTATAAAYAGKTYWISPNLPSGILEDLSFPEEIEKSQDEIRANIKLVPENLLDGSQPCLQRFTWVYALVAPFPTVTDGVDEKEILAVWQGELGTTFPRRPLMMDAETAEVFRDAWGEPASGTIKIFTAEELVDTAWAAQYSWGIVPFERLQPRWKVLRVSGKSPLDKTLDISKYPLAISFCWTGDPNILVAYRDWIVASGNPEPATNRDVDKMTVLNMTGVTAMVRGTAATMEDKGITYPAQDVGAWLREADLTHISNEVSFSADCPPGLPFRSSASFCSPESYFALIEVTGADIIELTGNHINDWGTQAFLHTLDIYKEKGLHTFGGGANLEEARKPLLLVDHGNRLAFIGCNAAGPERAWATADQPGAAPCDREWLTSEISSLREQGYLPIVTFQHLEVCSMVAHMTQITDFEAAARAGAVIVSGSQAHCPQMFAFVGDAFIHYGLGNLFFDQMDFSTRRGFMDRHIFYDGKYLGTELATTMIEEAARPRFMENAERRQLLHEIFLAGGWW